MAEDLRLLRNDDRIARLLADPVTYIAEARERARAEILAKVERRRAR